MIDQGAFGSIESTLQRIEISLKCLYLLVVEDGYLMFFGLGARANLISFVRWG